MNFEDVVKNGYKIFADTSSLMHQDAEYIFFRIVAPALHQSNQRLIVPKSVLNEIDKHISKSNKDAEKAKHIIRELGKFGLYGVNSTFDKQFADNAIITQFNDLRIKYNLCLITNDYSKKNGGNLAQDILDLKNSKSTQGIKDIQVFFIKNNSLVVFNSHKKIPKVLFNLQKIPKKDNSLLNPTTVPSAGEYVIDNAKNRHYLQKQIGRTGGEGSVYLTDTGFVCKIYKSDKNTKFRKEKITLLTQADINIKNVCLPKRIVFNLSNEFVGYLMPKASGAEMKTSIFIPPLFKQKFPHWNRVHLVKIAIGILGKVEELHRHNIILGDINPSNILIENENEVYFIDTDSYQIEDYPCAVGMIPYTKAIHHGKSYDSYLRTKEDDIYALSTLLFQLMFPGKLPYSFSGGGSERENMKPENFPYKCNDKGYKNAPDGQWVYIWSHLPFKLKELFCKIFRNNEQISLKELMRDFKHYLHQLEQGHQTNEVFPSYFKQINSEGKVIQEETVESNCSVCSKRFKLPKSTYEKIKSKGGKNGLKCDACRKIYAQQKKKCLNCGKSFHDPDHNYCINCRGEFRSCTVCGASFLFSESERQFYSSKGLSFPKKCPSCRGKTSNSGNTSSNVIGNSFFTNLFKW